MLRITEQKRADCAKGWYATAAYYQHGQGIVGCWGGKGAARLRLEGTVGKVAFGWLCRNVNPKTRQRVTVRRRPKRTVGYTFRFSVSKSVSLLYGVSGDGAILDAFRAAVDESMREMEAEMKTRVRKKRQDIDRTTGNMVWAEFIHTTSRPVDGVPDPQLHAHCFVFNATWDECEGQWTDDGKGQWKAGQFSDLKRDAPYFQAAFRVRLANKLQDLGFGVERKRDDFEIAGIPKDVLGRFSRRTAVIEKVAKEKGISDPKRKDGLGAETREKKTKALSWEQLRKEWNARLSDQEGDVLAAVHRREQVYARGSRGEAAAVDHAIEHSFTREAVVPERKLLTEALKKGIGTVTVEGVASEMHSRPLIRSDVDGRRMATTRLMRDMEKQLIEFAREGRGSCRPMGNPARPCSNDDFTKGQRDAVAHVLGSRDRVMVIRGGAGTGKTSLERELGQALAEIGKPVVAMAGSTKARDALRMEAGFGGAETVAMFLKDQRLQEAARGGLMLVDEASQLGTRDMLKLFDLAQGLGARVLLVGDKRQHRSVTAGEPLKLLEDRAGLRVAEVTEIVRQKDADYKKVAEALGEGRIGDAFAQLDGLGWIREVPDEERYRQLADAYLAAACEKKKNGEYKSALVVSPTHAEGDRITLAIRDGLKAQGRLGKERIIDAWVPTHLTDPQKKDATEYEPGYLVQFQQNAKGYKKGSRLVVGEGVSAPIHLADRFEVYRPVQLALAVGDRIRITAGGKTKDGHRLANGELLTVEGFNKRGDIIVDHGWVIDRDFGHLRHGYCVTSHASQGDTVDKVFVAIGSQSLPATNERTAIVSLTRGREQAVIFTDDRKELLKAVGRPDDPLSATELSDSAEKKQQLQGRLKRLAAARGLHLFGQPGHELKNDRGLDHAG